MNWERKNIASYCILFFAMVVSPLLVSFSFPQIGLGWLAWFGLSPLLFELRRKNLLEAAIVGFLFGCFFVIGVFSWAIRIGQINLPSFLIGLIIFALYFLIFGFFYRLISKSIGSWIIIGAPCLWVTLEYIRSNLFFLSWPWNLLGHSQYCYLPVIQIADITGVYGISFLIVMVNQFLSQVLELILIRHRNSSSQSGNSHNINWVAQFLVISFMLVFTFCYGWYRLATPENRSHLRVALVQANVLARSYMPLADQVKHLQEYERLTQEAAQKKPHLIIWPASSLPAMISTQLVQSTIKRLTNETGAYLLVGGAGYEKLSPQKDRSERYANSEYLISPSGQLEDQYHKIKLLAFNEYLPLTGIVTWPEWISTLKENFVPGERHTVFQVSGTRFSTPICWENLFPDLFRRFVRDDAQFMVSITNEGFFGNTSGPYQSLAINTFRAVENRVAIARAATTGVSCFINPNGQIEERVHDNKGKDLFISGFLVRDIPLSNQKTFYTIYGEIFAYVVIGILSLMILVSILPQKFFSSRISN